MKRILSFILALAIIYSTLLTLSSCDNDAIELLNAELEEYTLLLDEANKKIANLEAQNKTLKEEKSDLQSKVKKLKNEIEDLEIDIADLEAQKKVLNDKASSFAAEKEALEAEIASLTARVEELEDLIAVLNNCLNGLHTYTDGVCAICGAEAFYCREGEYIYFGEYPQTVKADDVTITAVTDNRGYYLGSDGCYYAKVTASPYDSYTFSNGDSIENGTVHYFKVEPLRWRIFSEENGVAYVLCDSIIANMAYQNDYYVISSQYYTDANGAPSGTYAYSYEHSSVRMWLNNSFYTTAFDKDEQAAIITTEINDYSDKIFLPSYKEMQDFGYAWPSQEKIYIFTSDYSLATGASIGAFHETIVKACGNTHWMVRAEADNQYSYSIHRPYDSGHASLFFWIDDASQGVVPALKIQL